MRSFYLLGLFLAFAAAAEDFSNFKVYRVTVENEAQAEYLHKLQGDIPNLDFWTEIRHQGPVDIMVGPQGQSHFEKTLSENHVAHTVMIENVERLMNVAPMTKGSSKQADHDMDWESYHPIEDMYSYLDYLEANFDDVTTMTIGQSFEGEDMRVIQICRNGCGNKPALFIEGGIHAREWISPAVVTFMVKQLTEDIAGNEDLVENLDWYILPSVNPDGYAYTQSDNRLWRKTRSENNLVCKGADANRNWGYHWNDGGSSSNSCDDTFMGTEAFSEVENRNIRDFIDARKDNIVFFNDVHSYSQLILLPWGFTTDPCPGYDDIFDVMSKANDALYAVHQKNYDVGCIPCLLYVASGGTMDWTLGEANVKYSIGMELRDTGLYGFLLPPDQIIPTGEEVWAFHMSVARDMISEFVPKA